jgi:ketosteroid isomerase-like protein
MPSGYDVFAALLRAFEAADAGAALGLCTHDVVFEFPFLHVAFGRSDFTPVVDTMSRLQGLQFTDLRIEPLAAAGAYLATYSGTATVSATGRSYNQCYINRFEIEDGLVKRFAEHFDTAVYRGAFARSAG